MTKISLDKEGVSNDDESISPGKQEISDGELPSDETMKSNNGYS